MEPIRRSSSTDLNLDKIVDNEFQPNEVLDIGQIPDFVAFIANSFAESGLRPPELQFDDQVNTQGPLFETQALQSMDILRADTQENNLNTLASLIVQNSQDIAENGSDSAKDGLRVIDDLVQQTAQLLAARLGKK